MKTIFLILLVSLMTMSVHAQYSNTNKELVVVYQFDVGCTYSTVTLRADGHQIYNHKYIIEDKGTSAEREFDTYLYMDLSKGYLVCKSIRIGGDHYLKESINLFHWKVTDRFVKILGYACQEAKAHYRGRDYTAYFTTEVPFNAAPWKFHGLPGVMLKVVSDDGEVQVVATSLKIGASTSPIINPYKSKKTVTWDQLVKILVHYETSTRAWMGFNTTISCTGMIEENIIFEQRIKK